MEDTSPILLIENFLNENTEKEINATLDTETISVVCLHDKFIAIGFSNGLINLFDHIGTKCKSIYKTKHLVSGIDIDLSGEFMAVTWKYNKIYVVDLSSSKDDVTIETPQVPLAICINPYYNNRKSKSIIYAVNDTVLLFTRGLISNTQKTLLANQRNVRTIKWCERFVAWAGPLEANVFDIQAIKWIGNLQFQNEQYVNASSFVSIQWRDETTLVLATTKKIFIYIVIKRINSNKKPTQNTELPEFGIELVQSITIDSAICGMCVMLEKIACIRIENSKLPDESNQCLAIITLYSLNKNLYEKMGVEKVTLALKEPDDLLELTSLPIDISGFIFFKQYIFLLKPRTQDDVINSLIENNRFKEAYFKVKENKNKASITLKNVGKKYVNSLLDEQDFEGAVKILNEFIKEDIRLWENMVQRFLISKKIQLIVPFIPCSENSFLSLQYYNDILAALVSLDSTMLENCILKWPKCCYDPQLIVNLIDSLDEKDKSNSLLRIQALLYAQNDDYSRGLIIYIRLKDPRVFEHIVQHDLFKEALQYISDLLEVDQNLAIKLFVKYNDKFYVMDLIPHFKNNDKALNDYLAKLYFESSTLTKKCIDIQIKLHAKYSRELLLPLLQDSLDYNLTNARTLCESLNYSEEYCYLSEKMGDNKSALKGLILKLNDVQAGVNFCNRIKDQDLWNDLKEYCFNDPKKISLLLTNTKHHLDPVQLIQSIPDNMEFENLKDTICKVLYDTNTKLSLMNCCRKILESDNIQMLEFLEIRLNEGCIIDIYTKCYCCHETIVIEKKYHAQEAVVFICKHAFHSVCLTNRIGRDDICIACSYKYKNKKATKLYDLT